jgi:hypothetical protein
MLCLDSISDTTYDVVSTPDTVDRLLFDLGRSINSLSTAHLIKLEIIILLIDRGNYYAKNRFSSLYKQ